MNDRLSKYPVCLAVVLLSIIAYAQKVKVGYDKSVDFSQYKTYEWTQPATPPTRPLLYMMVVDAINYELKAKGLAVIDKKGDLILTPAGGAEFGVNIAAGTPIMPGYGGPPPAIDATMWTGAGGASNPVNAAGPSFAKGTLMLTFVDRVHNRVIWTGTVKENFELDNKKKALERMDRAITKLLKEFPPKKK